MHCLGQLLQKGVVGNNETSVGVLYKVTVVFGAVEWIDRHRHSTDANRTKESNRKGRGITQHQRYTLLATNAKLHQGTPHAANAIKEAAVGYLLVGAVDGYLVPTAGVEV